MEWIFWTMLTLAITTYKVINRYFEYKENINKNKGIEE